IRAVDEFGTEGEVVAEGTATGQTDISTAATIVIPTYLFSSGRVLTSWQLTTDLGDLLPGYLAQILGRRVGRRLNGALTTGEAAGEPSGIVPRASVTVNAT